MVSTAAFLRGPQLTPQQLDSILRWQQIQKEGEPFEDPASSADLNQSLGQTGIPAGKLPPLYARDVSNPMMNSQMLQRYLPQMGMLGGMYGGGQPGGMPGGMGGMGGGAGMPMQNAAPQLPLAAGGASGGGQPYSPLMGGPTPPQGAQGASPTAALTSITGNPALMKQLSGLGGYLKGGGSDANPGMSGMLSSLFGGAAGAGGYSGLLGGGAAAQGGLGGMSFADMLAAGMIAV